MALARAAACVATVPATWDLLEYHFPAGPLAGCILAVIITRCIVFLNTEGRRRVFLDIFVWALCVLLTAIWVQSHDLDLLAAGVSGIGIASLGIGVISIATGAFAGRFKAALDAFISGAPRLIHRAAAAGASYISETACIPDQIARELNVTPFGPGTSKGARLLQEYLNPNGLGGVVDGDWRPATSRAHASLHPDPTRVTPDTMSRLAQPLIRMIKPLHAVTSLAAAIVATALVHLRAHPIEIGGQNAVPFVRVYMNGNKFSVSEEKLRSAVEKVSPSADRVEFYLSGEED